MIDLLTTSSLTHSSAGSPTTQSQSSSSPSSVSPSIDFSPSAQQARTSFSSTSSYQYYNYQQRQQLEGMPRSRSSSNKSKSSSPPPLPPMTLSSSAPSFILPLETLILICSHLSKISQSSLISLTKVCRSWRYHLINEPSLWSVLRLNLADLLYLDERQWVAEIHRVDEILRRGNSGRMDFRIRIKPTIEFIQHARSWNNNRIKFVALERVEEIFKLVLFRVNPEMYFLEEYARLNENGSGMDDDDDETVADPRKLELIELISRGMDKWLKIGVFEIKSEGPANPLAFEIYKIVWRRLRSLTPMSLDSSESNIGGERKIRVNQIESIELLTGFEGVVLNSPIGFAPFSNCNELYIRGEGIAIEKAPPEISHNGMIISQSNGASEGIQWAGKDETGGWLVWQATGTWMNRNDGSGKKEQRLVKVPWPEIGGGKIARWVLGRARDGKEITVLEKVNIYDWGSVEQSLLDQRKIDDGSRLGVNLMCEVGRLRVLKLNGVRIGRDFRFPTVWVGLEKIELKTV